MLLGDGGPAINAELNGPGSVALDIAGNLYISEVISGTVRKVTFWNNHHSGGYRHSGIFR